MKNFLLSISILLILITGFSKIESRIESDYSFGNWAFYGNSGAPVSGEGEQAGGDTFSFGKTDPANGKKDKVLSNKTNTEQKVPPAELMGELHEYFPITVEVVQEKKDGKRVSLETRDQIFYIIANTLIIMILIELIAVVTLTIVDFTSQRKTIKV